MPLKFRSKSGSKKPENRPKLFIRIGSLRSPRQSLGDGVAAAAVKGVAFEEAFGDEPEALKKSVCFNRLDGIFGAAWEKAAAIAEKGADRRLVESQ